VVAAKRNSPWLKTTGDKSKKNLKRASNTNFSGFYFGSGPYRWQR